MGAAAKDFETYLAGNKSQLLKYTHAFSGETYAVRIELPEDLPLKQAPLLWESVSEEENKWWWVNPEMLVHKESALRFVEPRLVNLLKLRSVVVKEMGEIAHMITALDLEIEAGLPAAPPAGYEPWRLNGPLLYYHCDQFGRVDWAERSAEVQRRAKEVGFCPFEEQKVFYPYPGWNPQMAWERQRQAFKAFKLFNRDYLAVKLEALRQFVNGITNGADGLLLTYLRGRSCLGGAYMGDYEAQFMDKNIWMVEHEVNDMIMDDIMLSHGDDADDSAPAGNDFVRTEVLKYPGATVTLYHPA